MSVPFFLVHCLADRPRIITHGLVVSFTHVFLFVFRFFGVLERFRTTVVEHTFHRIIILL